jgi:multidrug efflux pump subunit AcrB
MFSFGAGAELPRPLGYTIVGVLLLSQWLRLYTIPIVLALPRQIGRLA